MNNHEIEKNFLPRVAKINEFIYLRKFNVIHPGNRNIQQICRVNK